VKLCRRCNNNSAAHEFILTRGTCDYILLNAYYCALLSSRVKVGVGLDLASGWLVVMHTYFYHFPPSLYRNPLPLSFRPVFAALPRRRRWLVALASAFWSRALYVIAIAAGATGTLRLARSRVLSNICRDGDAGG